jgi:hypothetical protein
MCTSTFGRSIAIFATNSSTVVLATSGKRPYGSSGGALGFEASGVEHSQEIDVILHRSTRQTSFALAGTPAIFSMLSAKDRCFATRRIDASPVV